MSERFLRIMFVAFAEKRLRFFQTSLADVTPRTDGVGVNFKVQDDLWVG
jgi:hypothetical protein